MQAPVLDRRLILEDAVRVADGSGGYTDTWSPLGELWALVTPRSGNERGIEGATLSGQAYRVTVRAAAYGAPSRPRPDQRFRDGTRIYKILSVADNDDKGRYLTCAVIEEVAS